MTISKSLKRLLIVLSLVIIYALIDLIINREQYGQIYFSDEKPIESSENLLIEPKLKNPQIKKSNHEFKWGKDPFRHPKKPQVKPEKKSVRSENLILQAITYAGENSFVMINDVILRKGEIINGFKVVHIQESKVELSKDGRFIYLNSE